MMLKKHTIVQSCMIFLCIFFIFSLQQYLHYFFADPPLPHFGLLMFLPFLFLFISLFFFLRLRWFFISLWFSLFTFTIIGDIVYYKFFNTFPTLLSRIPFKQTWDVRDSIISLLTSQDILYLSLPLVFWIYSIIFYRWESLNRSQNCFKKLLPRSVASILGITITFALYFYGLSAPIIEKTHHQNRSLVTTPEKHWGAKFSNVDYVKIFGILNFHLHDIYRLYEEKAHSSVPLDSKTLESAKRIINEKYLCNTESSEFFGIAKGYNVLFILLESYQHFLVDLKVDNTEVIPFLNQLRKNSFHWDYIYDASFRGRTSDVEFMINTGLYPDMEKTPAFYHINQKLITFPNLLKKSGYKTYTFHGYKGDFWNRRNSHPFYGIDNLRFRDAFPNVEKLGMGVPDKVVFPEAVKTLAQANNSFFGFIISLSGHHPYNKQPSETEGLFPSVESEFASGYLKLAHYTDQAIKLMYDELRRNNLLDNTIIVIFGDHDLGSFTARSNSPTAQKIFSTWEKNSHVNPFDIKEDRVFLLIDIPSQKDKIKNFNNNNPNVTGTLTDLFPTVFHLMGRPIPKGILGTHLFHKKERLTYLPPAYDFKNWTGVDRFLNTKELYSVRKNNGQVEIKAILNRYGESPNKEKLYFEYRNSQLIHLTNIAILNNNLQNQE